MNFSSRAAAVVLVTLATACTAGDTTPQPEPDVTPPSVPQGVGAVSPLPTRTITTWTASADSGSGVGGYQVFRDGSLVGTVTAPAVSFQDDGLSPSTSYAYTVKAFDRAAPPNVSGASAPASVTTLAAPDLTPPTVPGNVAATATSHQRVLVTWTASTDAGAGLAGYELRRDGVLLATLGPSALSYEDLSVLPSTSYAYTLRAFDAAVPPNASADSPAANATTPAAPDLTPPSVPGNVAATATSPTRVVVTWNASTDSETGVAGYDVRRDGVQIGSVSAPAASYQDDTVLASVTYAYSVRAFDAAAPPNASAWSAAASVTTPAPSGSSGLDTRPSNATCVAPARPTPGGGVDRVSAFPSLPGFSFPVKALQAPGDPSRWFVLEQAGRVRVFSNQPNVSSSTLFADLSARVRWGGELGLLGMAFHPSWPIVPDVFILYTAPSPLRTVVSRFTSHDMGLTIDDSPAGEQVVLTVLAPGDGHKGGDMAFGTDGFLYLGIGDGGGEYDTYGHSQDLGSLLAKFLRIDVTGTGAGYAIPADNPWAGPGIGQCPPGGRTSPPCPETWAFGFRNPWRWSFDRATGDLWAGDVGQKDWEEVDRVERGANYGWVLREGRHCTPPATSCPQPGTFVNGGVLVDPVTEFAHAAGQPFSITGGYVYRGSAIPSLAGLYLFGDYGSGQVYTHQPGVTGSITPLIPLGFAVSSFAEDVAGELYAVDYGGGRLYRLQPSGSPGVDTVPFDLAAACPSAVDPDGPGSTLVAYGLNAPFWSDGASKSRWMALPDGTSVTLDASGDWDFPTGTVLVKAFRLGGKLVETRLLMRHTDGSWAGYSYEWNDAQTAATKVVGGKTKSVGTQTWLYPSSQQCLQCHTGAAGFSLGAETAQQNGDFTYARTGRTANQLTTLQHIGIVTLPGPPGSLPAYPSPFGTGPLEARARAYLHSNCAGCHRPGGPTPSTMDLRYSTPLGSANVCGVSPSIGDLGIAGAQLVAPGSPGTSILLERMSRLDSHRMPPIGRFVVDQQGVQVVSDWIAGLTGCP